MTENKSITIEWDFFLKGILFIISLYFLYLIKDLIIWFVFALVLSILFDFPINFLQKKKIPRVLATFLVYFSVLFLMGGFFYKTAPLFLSEIRQFTQNLPVYLGKIAPFLNKIGVINIQHPSSLFPILEQNLTRASKNIIDALITIFGGIKATIFIVFLAFFLSLEENFLERFLENLAPYRYKKYLLGLLPRAKKKVNGWFISRVVGVLFVGILTYAVLWVLGVKYSFILSLIFGVLDFIPIVGPIIGGAIVILVVAVSSLAQALFVAVALVIIQQLENNLLFPILFKRFVGIPPSLVLIALAIGGELWGLLGAILAVPLAAVIFEMIKDYIQLKKKKEVPQTV